ncbi:MAG: hypothetical protein JWN98_7 [Abditibacteriota bacterium]|nr:hypothetical protein [Abditibacteriota bacterium]
MRQWFTHLAWCALFIALLISGTPDGALWVGAKRLHLGLLIVALAACWLAPPARSASHVSAPRAFVRFYRVWLSLPLPLLSCALLFVIGLTLSTRISTAAFLSVEYSGLLWGSFIAAALLLAYTAHAPCQAEHVTGGLIAALDIAVVAAVAGLLSRTAATTTLVNLNAHVLAVLFACAMPLAWYNATLPRSRDAVYTVRNRPASNGAGFKVLWARAGAVYRRMRPGIMLGIVLFVGNAATALVLVVAWTGHLLLRARQTALLQRAPAALSRLWPQYAPTLFNGFLWWLILSAWGSGQTLPHAVSLAGPWAIPAASNIERTMALSQVRDVVLARPFFGWGPGAFALQVPEFARVAWLPLAPGAPNTWLRALVECGLVTTLAALGACCFIAWQALSRFWKSGFLQASKEEAPEEVGALDAEAPALLASTLATAVASGLFGFSVVPFFALFAVSLLALLAQSGFSTQDIQFQNSEAAASHLKRQRVAKRVILHALLFIAGLQLITGVPRVWRALQAQQFYETALQSRDDTTRFGWLLKAREREPESALYWAQLGLAKFQHDGPTAARATTNFFRQAAHRAPHDAWWWHNLGALYLSANDYPQAIRNATRATKADPNWWLARLHLAYALEKQGDTIRGRAQRQMARALWSKYYGPHARTSLAYIGAASNSDRYRRPMSDNQLIVAPIVLADRAFFVVHSKTVSIGSMKTKR